VNGLEKFDGSMESLAASLGRSMRQAGLAQREAGRIRMLSKFQHPISVNVIPHGTWEVADAISPV
jgi:hypothetical protein